ncbi:MAG TPA: chaperonin GroEL [Dehalococcoidia bacterium]|nr:chaperonin GroEL [Chloroflexota bacterium]HAA95050.1 chaperonin GroEL [Dehalococcoidia bacterium]|tara:strand:+ start:1089 stop:2714 length:1626 start_codon:yes stop_codon:yes gene_type:complete
MADKQLVFDEEARASLLRGVDELRRVVGLTLGPSGRNVVLSRLFGLPIVCSDGVTIAKEVELPEPYENLGAQLVKEAASKTNDAVGDGTTTSVVLAQALVHNGFLNVAAGSNGMGIREGVDLATEAVINELKSMAIPVEDRDRVARVAALSAHEEPIAELLADALDKVGRDGVVTIEESKALDNELEFVEGVRVDRGYISPHFVSDTQRMEVAIDSPMFLLTDQKISSPNDVVGIMEKLVQSGNRSLVIIAEDVEGEALSTLVVNKMRGTIDCLAIKAPGFGERRKALLEDIAIVTGGTVISSDRGLKVEDADIPLLGTARRIVANKDESTIIEGRGDDQAIKERLDQLRVQIEETSSDYDREKLQERMAALVGGVAVLKIGGATEPEVNEKKSRAEDALSATRAAIEEGIVPGGGVALVRAGKVLADLEKTVQDEQALGVRMVADALSAPLLLIAQNAGHEGEVVLEGVRSGEGDWGFDADKGEFCNLVEVGIIDPVKVTRSALQNACSIAGMMMTTEAIITEIPEFIPLPEDIQDFMYD